MSSPQNTLGIKDRLRAASSEEEIDALLTEGSGYFAASKETRRGWKRIAKRRREQLRKTES